MRRSAVLAGPCFGGMFELAVGSPINLVAADLLSEDLLAARRSRPVSHQQAEPVRLATREPWVLPPASPPAPFLSPARILPPHAAHLSAPPSATSHSGSHSGSCSRAVGSGRAEGRDVLERLVGQRIERQRLRPHHKPGDREIVRPGPGLRAVLQREIDELQARSTAFGLTPTPAPTPTPTLTPTPTPTLTPTPKLPSQAP